MVALSTGVIGLVCYLGFSLACLLHWLRGLAFDDPVVISVSIGAIAGVVVILVNGLSSGILWRVHLNLSYTLVVAAAMGTVEAERCSFQRPIYEAAPPESKQSDA
jgi:O-antigen ligase